MFALAAAAEIALLRALSSTPGETLAPALPGPSGNLLHVVAYGVLCGLLIRAWVPLGSSWTDPAAWPGLRDPRGVAILVLVAIAGLADEIHQHGTPGRTCSVLDVFADVLGGVCVLTWPGAGPGRPRRFTGFALAVIAALFVAVYGWLDRPFPDRVLQDWLD